jgi:transcriptional regulator with XRE-family HTH domain
VERKLVAFAVIRAVDHTGPRLQTDGTMKDDTHSPDHARLGRAVRELRARRGLSQEELGFRAGLHRNYVGAIERGEINPTFRVLLKLERGLQLPLSEIIQLWERRATDTVAPRLRRPPVAPPIRRAPAASARGARSAD